MRRFNSRRKRLNFSKLLIACLVIVFITAVFLVLKSGILNIREVEIDLDKNLDCVNSNQLKETTGVLGQNLFFVEKGNIAKNIKDKFVCVKDISLQKFFPGKIRINVSGREPAVILNSLKPKEATSSSILENIATPSANLSSESFLADKEGIIFSTNVNNLSLTQIFLDEQNFYLGKKLDSKTENSLLILEKLNLLGFGILTTQILDNFFIIFPTNSNPRVIFSLDNPIDTQIASLQLILEKAKINSEFLEFIDLRFDKPIVKFAPERNK